MGKERKKKKTTKTTRKVKNYPPPPELPPPPPALPGDVNIPLNDEERLWVAEWLICRNSTQAYAVIHPEVCARDARLQGRAFFARPHVREECRAAIHAQCRRRNVTADRTMNEIARCAYSDILDLYDPITGLLRMPRAVPLEARSAISQVRINRQRRTETRNGKSRTVIIDTVVEYRLWNKLEALRMLANTLGLETEVTPLDQLLRLLPVPLADQIRSALAEQERLRNPTAQPLQNGRH